ncbi:hypothetical protein EB001_23705 [bacterium]|jgi:hypothetical protein|nr:hypothetical protein [bacterium]
MTDKQKRFALLSRFDKYYKFKLEQEPRYNKWVEQWSANALIESYGLELCYELLEYYFEVTDNPSWSHFAYIAHDILERKQEQEKDLNDRLQRRKMAKEWLSE